MMTPEQIAAMRADAEAGTPGPWEEITPADNLWPPRVFSPSGIIALVDNSDVGQAERIANARLIAAAPDHAQTIRDLITTLQAAPTPEQLRKWGYVAEQGGESRLALNLRAAADRMEGK